MPVTKSYISWGEYQSKTDLRTCFIQWWIVKARGGCPGPRNMSNIAENRRARYEYSIEEQYEAGMVLAGWEVKAIRAGQVQLTDGYVLIR